MEKKRKNKKMKIVLVAFFLMSAIFLSICGINYKNNAEVLDPEKVALTFTETIVNRGDGYTAYNYTLLCKNYKYEDYVRENYIYPIIYAESHYQAGMDINNLNGLNNESYMGEKTKTDNGTLANEITDRMFPYYIQLMTELHGWDKYNIFYIKYFAKLLEVREEVFGDSYMTEEIMFSVLRANVTTYANKLTGTEEVTDENGNVQSQKTIGLYETKYGENCVFTCTVTETEDITLEEYNEHIDEATFKTYKISTKDITEVKAITINIQANDKTVVEAWKLLVVKADGKWYVDNTNTNTTTLYNFYK